MSKFIFYSLFFCSPMSWAGFILGARVLDQQYATNPTSSLEEPQTWNSFVMGYAVDNFEYSFEYGLSERNSQEGFTIIQTQFRRGIINCLWRRSWIADTLDYNMGIGVGLWNAQVRTLIGSLESVELSKNYFISRAAIGLDWQIWRILVMNLGVHLSFGENLSPSPQLGWNVGLGIWFE